MRGSLGLSWLTMLFSQSQSQVGRVNNKLTFPLNRLNFVLFSSLLFSILLLTFPMTVHAKSKSSQQIEDSCKECREMVGMFMDEFRATDTGLYEGGDTAWEVKNLKDYRKSELRLIEITDKMFKSKKDKISRMLEKVEDDLESFWFSHWDHLNAEGNSELEDYLCVSLLKYCCAYGHFGPDCLPCRVRHEDFAHSTDPKTICFDHGTCSGNGTRTGTGDCKCDSWHQGKFCDECKKGYTRDEGEDAFTMCRDIDECNDLDNHNPCVEGEFCDNYPGYFKCEKCHPACNGGPCTGFLAKDCTVTACAEGYELIPSDEEEEEKADEENGGSDVDQERPRGCRKIGSDSDEDDEEGVVPKILSSLLKKVPLEVKTIGGYVLLVAVGARLLGRYNKMVALTMLAISLLFGFRHYSMFIDSDIEK
ncbi:cysteine-rich with EGF-like domain protein 2 isoform X2 [Symsagittifera roscoffensis]|uniref:cysteine-rich with EGF-like domain protein 2 isoform X2 n=1 Tax=Symsagittifera roscoffensis TaxID=84072 RepID=UPI00307BD4F8